VTEQSLQQNATRFRWDQAKAETAFLLAEGRLTHEEIASKVGVERTSLWRWGRHPEFRSKVASHAKDLGDAVVRRGIARRVRRIEAMHRRWQKMHQVIAERAADPEMIDVPGGKTGLLVHRVKGIGRGPAFRVIDLYEVDTGLLRELRKLEKQAAQEMGQWGQKVEATTPDSPIGYDDLADEQIADLILAILGAAPPGGTAEPAGGGDCPAAPAGAQPTADCPRSLRGLDLSALPPQELDRLYLEELRASG
jgi:hypothetical protein